MFNLKPEFCARDVRPDWEFFAMTQELVRGWAAGDLAGIGADEIAADLFDLLFYGA